MSIGAFLVRRRYVSGNGLPGVKGGILQTHHRWRGRRCGTPLLVGYAVGDGIERAARIAHGLLSRGMPSPTMVCHPEPANGVVPSLRASYVIPSPRRIYSVPPYSQ
jgi:hypothetical protein